MAGTIIVEDGSVVTGANSYITVAELDTYASCRNITITASDKEALLFLSMDYVENLEFLGFKFTTDQLLQWPRAGVSIDHFFVDSDEIPQLLKDGQAEAALGVDRGISEIADIPRVIDSATADVLTVEFSKNGQATTINRALNAKLRKLLAESTSGITFSVSRG